MNKLDNNLKGYKVILLKDIIYPNNILKGRKGDKAKINRVFNWYVSITIDGNDYGIPVHFDDIELCDE